MKSLVLPALCLIAANGAAQGTTEDYQRAYSLYGKFNATQVYDDPADITWDGKNVFHYTAYTPEGMAYYVGKTTGNVQDAEVKAVQMEALAALLARETGKDIKADALKLSRFKADAEQPTTVSFEFEGYKWKIEEACTENLRLAGEKEALPPKKPQRKPRHWMEVDDEKGAAPVASPDGKRQAYIKNDNVYVSDRDGRNERALSNDGTAGNYYSSWIKWSPDGKYVCANKIRPAEKRYVYYVESSPKNQLQPILHKQEYAKPGDELRFKVPCIFEVETGRAVIPSTELFNRQYDLYGPQWKEDGKAVTFEYNERGHKTYRMLELDAETGKMRTLVEESSPTFVNYNRTFRHILKGGKQMVWMSERDNWTHLYMIDLEKGKVDYQITKGEWVVRRVLRVDEERNTLPEAGINVPDSATNTSQGMLVRISEIEVYPEYINQYLSMALEVGATSVREEPGVIAIFPMVQQRDSCQIRILEIYASQEAYKHHIGTKHFQTYKQGTLHMVKSLDLVDMQPMNPSAMPEIFLKMKRGK